MICPRKNSPPPPPSLLADDSSSVVVVDQRLSAFNKTPLMTWWHTSSVCWLLTIEDIDWLFHPAEFRLCIIIKSVWINNTAAGPSKRADVRLIQCFKISKPTSRVSAVWPGPAAARMLLKLHIHTQHICTKIRMNWRRFVSSLLRRHRRPPRAAGKAWSSLKENVFIAPLKRWLVLFFRI
jgi:hypothetical protein